MAISSHPALEAIPPLVYSTLRIAIALPLLLLSARLQVGTARLSVFDLLTQSCSMKTRLVRRSSSRMPLHNLFDDHGTLCNPALARRSRPACAVVTLYIATN